MIEHIRINTFALFVEYLDDICDLSETIKRTNGEKITMDKAIHALRKKVGRDEFLFLLQKVNGKVEAMSATILVTDMYEEVKAYQWLMAVTPRGKWKPLTNEILKWLKELGIKTAVAVDTTFVQGDEKKYLAKRRLMERFYKFKPICVTYEREI